METLAVLLHTEGFATRTTLLLQLLLGKLGSREARTIEPVLPVVAVSASTVFAAFDAG